VENSGEKNVNCASVFIFQKLPKVNSRSMGEKSLKLVTLILGHSFPKQSRLKMVPKTFQTQK
jgi:hypothetical protein